MPTLLKNNNGKALDKAISIGICNVIYEAIFWKKLAKQHRYKR